MPHRREYAAAITGLLGNGSLPSSPRRASMVSKRLSKAVRGSARAEAGESCTAQEGLRGRGAHPDLGVRLAHSL